MTAPRRWAAAAVLLLAFALPVHRVRAETCDAALAQQTISEVSRDLAREDHDMRRWNGFWTVTFAAGAALSFGLAASDVNPLGPDDGTAQVGNYVGGGKALIGVASQLLAKRVPQVALTGDVCADADALEAALRKTARRERAAFYTNHIGGIVLNVAGAIVIGTVGEGREAAAIATSVGLGYPIGLLSNYTMPHRAWRLYRARRTGLHRVEAPSPSLPPLGLSIHPPLGDHGWGLSVTGAF